ncbi:MAG: class I SAM-dependent methyltransferase [Candidatus Binatota bacterium]|nr:class I SAM-dependent methyltransferase [Candidatus Binatota bacterium]
MIWLSLLLIGLVICFGGVLLVGAPYLPTLNPQLKAALKLAGLKPGDTLLELGCGDGRVLIAAARQGLNTVGYELNPLLALVAWLRTRRYRKQIKIIWGNFWIQQWPPADAIFVFLLPRYMAKLNKKVIQYPHQPVKLVSFAFTIPDRPSSSQKAGSYLYKYS